MPAMQAKDAAQAILACLIYRKRQWQPWWLGIAQIGSILLITPIYYFYKHLLKRKL
jgi:hypothetical protein